MNTDVNYPCPLRCEQSMEALLDYTAHKLEPHRRAMLEQHMLSCPECSAFRDDHAAVWKALDMWDPGPVTKDFDRRLWDRIDREKTGQRSFRRGPAVPWYTGAGLRSLLGFPESSSAQKTASWKPVVPLAAAALVVGAGFLLNQPEDRAISSSVSDESRFTASDAEQVERALEDIQLLRQFDAASSEGES